jgi:hypothetical protein
MNDGITYHLWSNKHQMWWRAASQGYSPDPADAGLYSEAEAIERVVNSAASGLLSQVTCMVAAPVNWTRS